MLKTKCRLLNKATQTYVKIAERMVRCVCILCLFIVSVLCITTTLESYANCSRCLSRLSTRESAVVGRQLFIRMGFSVTADINSNVVDIYLLVWSLSRLLYCVCSGTNVTAALLRLRLSDAHASLCPPPPGLVIVTDKRYHYNHIMCCARHP
jgi:hypothetical protein